MLWDVPDSRARKFAGLAVALLTSAALVALPGAPAEANCQDLLSNHTYKCRVKSDLPDKFDDCFSFITPGAQSDKFDLFSDLFGDALGCDCKVDGTFLAPTFGAANSFHCVSRSESGLGLAFDGTIKRRGRQLVGEAVNETGQSFIFRCDRRRSCELPVSTQGADAPSW